MKRVTITALISVLLLFASGINAQDLKFGHANVQEIMQAMPEFKEMQKQMETEYSQLENQLATMQEDYKTMEQDYMQNAKNLNAVDRQQKEQQLMQTSQKIQGFYQSTQQKLSQKQQQLQQPIMEKLRAAIEQVGEEGGFIYIFAENSGATVYQSDQSVNVTPLVKKKLGIN
ncbi:OmpH family outer membrane protein [Marinilabilia rubra]|uniref:Molecular chaperone Skp n=1 Tax=Marinilabilia rubra TaxID=2162893 RepID=A0A2U2B9W4_9BACT|nr:OmpH family outer membrane protein [Marinilabilia rubra]PWD99833.1 molecular chaperone Skp [Marinilabilia rubra]